MIAQSVGNDRRPDHASRSARRAEEKGGAVRSVQTRHVDVSVLIVERGDFRANPRASRTIAPGG
jgi:hypothetical protein